MCKEYEFLHFTKRHRKSVDGSPAFLSAEVVAEGFEEVAAVLGGHARDLLVKAVQELRGRRRQVVGIG